jgi:hypothetical protein
MPRSLFTSIIFLPLLARPQLSVNSAFFQNFIIIEFLEHPTSLTTISTEISTPRRLLRSTSSKSELNIILVVCIVSVVFRKQIREALNTQTHHQFLAYGKLPMLFILTYLIDVYSTTNIPRRSNKSKFTRLFPTKLSR